jgi:hypothetical protein
MHLTHLETMPKRVYLERTPELPKSRTLGRTYSNFAFKFKAYLNLTCLDFYRQAMRRLGEDSFNKVYAYLRQQRKGPDASNMDENRIFEHLKQLNVNPSDCFLVDQLLFLEEM